MTKINDLIIMLCWY